MRSVSSVHAGSKDRKSRKPQRLLSPVGTRADNDVMSNHDDRNGGEADVAYEAVAQLTVAAGSRETRSRHK